jgi:hypothetical protein
MSGDRRELVKNPSCRNTVEVLRKGPPNIPKIIANGKQYLDENFEGPNALWWEDYISRWNRQTINYYKKEYNEGYLYWGHWQQLYPDYDVLSQDFYPHFTDVV